ncbi:hypothetical protein K474DRAFT_1578449, partial [Panus rudis PR-1116 ss-1]
MKAFISCILKYDPHHQKLEPGLFGYTTAYYGCVECQGRGTLHCHMMIWLEGSLNPDQLKQRALQDPEFQSILIKFLDDAISNCIPDEPPIEISVPSSNNHPCSVRGINLDLPDDTIIYAQQKDIRNIAMHCQVHKHSATCYKYWQGPSESKECRFNLDSNNYQPITYIDPETGEINLRCLDGLVNNFNDTMIQAIRCNMDIKFILSGSSAKAVLYYITDYITKSQLKSHITFAALELAVHKLGEYNSDDDDLTHHAKCLLQKCAYLMISHQELSAPQVCSYLMDYEDHFTSHQYANLYWPSFEGFINSEQPCSECY